MNSNILCAGIMDVLLVLLHQEESLLIYPYMFEKPLIFLFYGHPPTFSTLDSRVLCLFLSCSRIFPVSETLLYPPHKLFDVKAHPTVTPCRAQMVKNRSQAYNIYRRYLTGK